MEMSITLAVTLILLSSILTLVSMMAKSTARNTKDAQFAADIDNARTWVCLWYDRFFSYDTTTDEYSLSLNEIPHEIGEDAYDRRTVIATNKNDQNKRTMLSFDETTGTLNVCLKDTINAIPVELENIKDVRFYLYTINGKNTVLRVIMYCDDGTTMSNKSPISFTLTPFSNEKVVVGKGVYS